MKHLSIFILIIILILGTTIFAGCTNKDVVKEKDSEKGSNKMAFIVETDYEFHGKVDDWYQCDIVMPKIADGVANGDKVNQELKTSFLPNSKEDWEQELKDGQLLPEFTETGIYERNYCVSNMHGICSLNIISTFTGTTHTVLKGNEFVHQDQILEWTRLELYSIYYNEDTGNVMTQDEFLSSINYTQSDIIQAFKEQYGSQYDKYKYGFSDILFWFDGNNELQLSDSIIRALTPAE